MTPIEWAEWLRNKSKRSLLGGVRLSPSDVDQIAWALEGKTPKIINGHVVGFKRLKVVR
jgi:hypothetical protein